MKAGLLPLLLQGDKVGCHPLSFAGIAGQRLYIVAQVFAQRWNVAGGLLD